MNYEKDLEKTAENYHKTILNGWENLHSILIEALYKRFKSRIKGGNILELGCGNGEMTEWLVKDFSSITVVDGSSVMLSECQKRLSSFENVKYVESYFENLELDETFDAIIMSHVLEHLDNPTNTLKHIEKFLKEDGVLLVAVPNADSFHRQVAVEMELLKTVDSLNEQDLLLGHRRVYNFERLIKSCKNAGYKVVDRGGIMLKPLTNRQIEQHWTKEMIDGFIALGDKYPELAAEIFVVLNKL